MNNQEIVNYVMNTPSNTNRAILNQMLDDRDVSWNDLKDKPFYEEIKTYPHTVLFDGRLDSSGGSDFYSAAVTSSGFAPGDIIEATYSGNPNFEDITITAVAENDGGGYNFATFEYPNHLLQVIFYTDEDELVVMSDYYTHAVIKLLKPREEVIIHQIEPKYLPNSVWIEKQTRVILENQTVKGVFHLTTDTFFAEGETVTVVWDGVTYERVAANSEYPWVDETAYLFDISVSGEPFAIECRPDQNDIVVVPCNGGRAETENTHTVSIYVYEEVVKTNCDLFAKVKWIYDSDGNEKCDGQLLQGDFATAKAKIQKGLPVRAFVINEYEPREDSGDYSSIITEVYPVYYFFSDNEEYLYLYGYYSTYLYPDNTITDY